ncbi:hypothetical protein [Paenibacillus sp. sgz302251]|uniref:hypothetical protein n=1 Tax=Paenibacillus sp. sgz302251 TaxID=3414493 RepID=UPI003C7BDEAF
MIQNQPYIQQSAVMPELYPQMQMSQKQQVMGMQAENEQTAVTYYQCCVDLSHMHDFHHMHHDLHDMHDFHPMMQHDLWDPHMYYGHHHHHPVDGWEYSTLDYHHAWVHPWMHHHVCFPVTCHPTGEQQASSHPYG